MTSEGHALDISKILTLPEEQKKAALELWKDLRNQQGLEAARHNFLPFVRRVWPGFVNGNHHKVMADAFDRVVSGECKRLIINMPPRHTKSEFASYLLPAYWMGHFPEQKVIQATHTANLSYKFGRKVRNLINSAEFQEIFQGVKLAADSQAAGHWTTNSGGEYFAVGTGGNVAGHGANLLIIDDPHSEQDVITGRVSPAPWDKCWSWYESGPRQRLQPDAAIVVVQTRWSTIDLTGRLLKAHLDGKTEWEVIELPAQLPSGKWLWPEYWSPREYEALKKDLDPYYWNAQYMQDPVSEEGALIKREWWQRWTQREAPEIHYTIVSWDTAMTTKSTSNYSACTVWGLFRWNGQDNIMLLEAFRDRWEFPELKQVAKRNYLKWKPDMLMVEAKAAGLPLIAELRAAGIPVMEYVPSRGVDKLVRVNSVADMFQSGMVWAPDTPWAEEVVEECAAFPVGEHDDYVDSMSQALWRFREGRLISLMADEEEEKPHRRRRAKYY